MTRDLFGKVQGAATVKRPVPRQDAEWTPEPPPSARPAPPPSRAFYRTKSRTLSHDEVLKLACFHEAAEANPDHDVIVVLDTTGPAFTFLVAVPRSHPSRLGPNGKPDRTKAPFWRHGEIIHIEAREVDPPSA